MSSATIGRLKQKWEQGYQNWSRRELSKKRYVYVWADGVYSNVRMDDRLCLLALPDGYRESEASWTEVLMDLKQRSLECAPRLAAGDGVLELWKAVAKCWPQTDQQRCWVHKTANGNSAEKMVPVEGYNLLADVVFGIKFVNGIKQQTGDQKQVAT